MRAWHVRENGEPADVMATADVAVASPGPGQCLVRVCSVALNFPDVLLVRGQYQERPPLPFVPGVELCGVVEGVGPGVDAARLGQRVVGTTVLPHGGLAAYALADTGALHPAPPELDDAAASAFHVAYQTGWFALHRRAGLRAGETLLVHAAAGGVGSAAVQLGRAAGAHVIAVVGSPEKVAVAQALGAHVVVDRTRTDVVAAVREATGGKGVDVVYDPVGGQSFQASTKLVRFEGRIVLVGFAGGQIQQIAANHALVKNYAVLGLHWGLYRIHLPDLVTRVHDELCGLVRTGAVAPLLGERLAFEDAAAGLSRLAAGVTVGRVTVSPP